MLLLGIDIGTSSIKVSVVDAQRQQCIASANYPETEAEIISKQNGWAEQNPKDWWENTQKAILKCNATKLYNPKDIAAIGIAYQMHGLVLVDEKMELLRNSIIWCDSRAVEIGNAAFEAIGEEKSLSHLLNSPGNFTASKLAWVKNNEPEIYAKIKYIMLPGDFIALKFCGNVTTSVSSLSEGVFWDFKNNALSDDVFQYFGFEKSLIPAVQEVFSEHGKLQKSIAEELGLTAGIPVTYKAGDQPNNALSLNVLKPGEVAATAGTSGVIYAVSENLTFDKLSRVNSFAHVNHTADHTSIGVLLCINGTGILNSWIKKMTGNLSYPEMNAIAEKIAVGSDGLLILPFGNGAERMLENKLIGAEMSNLDLNKHSKAHLFRASQEGIACAFKYGFNILQENNINPTIIKAGKANMFLSNVFSQAFVNLLNVPVELYNCDGSVGAAIGAGIGAGIFKDAAEAFSNTKSIQTIEPDADAKSYADVYANWEKLLIKSIHNKK